MIVCHQEVNAPTDLVEVDGCLGFGNVIVFDKEENTLVGEGAADDTNIMPLRTIRKRLDNIEDFKYNYVI